MKSDQTSEISFDYGSRESDVTSMLRDLQSCEDEIEKITGTVRKRNEGFASVKRALKGHISENQSVNQTESKITENGPASRYTETLDEKLDASRPTPEATRRSAILTGTALTRIMAFIEGHERQREASLNILSETALNFEYIKRESEQENDLIRAKLYIKPVDGSAESAVEKLPKFSSAEEKMAPRHVESIRAAVAILNSIAATTVSVWEKQKLRACYRKQLEDAHVLAQEQLTKQRDVLKNARNAIDVTEEKLRKLYASHTAKEQTKAQLDAELEELDFGKNSKEESERLVEVNDEIKKKSAELVALQRELENASLDTPNAKLEDRGATREADSLAVALDLAREALYDSNRRLIDVEKEKLCLRELLEKSKSAREKHLQDVESQNHEISVFQNDANHPDESIILSQDIERLFVSVVDVKKKNEMLQAQLDGLEGSKAKLLDEHKMLDESVMSLRTESKRCRNELLSVQKSIRASQREEAENMRNIDYITLLQPVKELTHLSTNQLNTAHDESPREFLALRTSQLFEKARREHRRYVKEMSTPDVETLSQHQCKHQQPQQPSCDDTSMDEGQTIARCSSTSNVAHHREESRSRLTAEAHTSELHYSQGNASMTTSVPLTSEGIPTSTTSRIVPNFFVGNSSAIPMTHTGAIISSPEPHGEFSSSRGIEDLTDTCIQNPQNQALSAGSTTTIARVNLRLQEILSRGY